MTTAECSHDVIYAGMCANCGEEVEAKAGASLKTLVLGRDGDQILMSSNYVKEKADEYASRLRQEGKLVLVLDIDHTILHATRDPRALSMKPFPALWKGVHEIKTSPRSASVDYIKLRPGLLRMLNKLCSTYDLLIYTHGCRSYANAVLSVIDPNGRLFKNTVCRDDFKQQNIEGGRVKAKDLAHLVTCDPSMIIVIDDRSDVWVQAENALKCLPFMFFTGLKEMYDRTSNTVPTAAAAEAGTAGVDTATASNGKREVQERGTAASPPSESGVKELESRSREPPDNVLLSLESVFHVVHALFYGRAIEGKGPGEAGGASGRRRPITQPSDQDICRRFRGLPVPRLLASIKKSILCGVVIVFSGVIPQGQPPNRAKDWSLAVEFGAVCYGNLDEDGNGNGACSLTTPESGPGRRVTHLVARRRGTKKVQMAESKGISVVHLNWLNFCTTHFKRAREDRFSLTMSQPSHVLKHAAEPVTTAEIMDSLARSVSSVSTTRKRPYGSVAGSDDALGVRPMKKKKKKKKKKRKKINLSLEDLADLDDLIPTAAAPPMATGPTPFPSPGNTSSRPIVLD